MFDPQAYRGSLEELGMHKASHQEVTMLDHMYRVCAIITDMKADDSLRLAALFHGAYGSDGLHSDDVESIPAAKREQVRAIVGEKVEQTIFNFSVMTYASISQSFRAVIRPNGKPQLKDRRDGTDLDVDREGFLDLLTLKLSDVLGHLPPQVGNTLIDVPAEHGEFWTMVADYLGDDALNTWTKVTEGKL